MQTRSKSQQNLYTVDIDFDEASKAWRENKKSIGNGSYKYICDSITKNGNKCGRKPLFGSHKCSMHNK